MSPDDMVLVRRDDLAYALRTRRPWDDDLAIARLCAAVNGEAASDERERANTAYDALREIETIMRAGGSDTSMLDGIGAIISNGPLDTAPGGPREDECHRLTQERDQYRDALERIYRIYRIDIARAALGGTK